MALQDLPPVPHQAPMTDKAGIPTAVWSDWFKRVFARLGGHHGNTGEWAGDQESSGYQTLPSGLMLQWGVTPTLASGALAAVSFPAPFPTACLQVIVGLKDMNAAATTATGHYGTGSYSAAGFEIYNRTSGGYVFNWFAIGY